MKTNYLFYSILMMLCIVHSSIGQSWQELLKEELSSNDTNVVSLDSVIVNQNDENGFFLAKLDSNDLTLDTLISKDSLQLVPPLKSIHSSLAQSKKQGIYSTISKSPLPYTLNDKAYVFGWHPHWMKEAYKAYQFQLLSGISYFSYELNPLNGGYKTIHDWSTTSLIDSAKVYECEVFLSVTNFGYHNNKVFLDNKKNQQLHFFQEITRLIKERGANGVTIDFEMIPKGYDQSFSNFIIQLSTYLKTYDSNYKVNLALPVVDFNQSFEVDKWHQYVDLFFIMGYDFFGSKSEIAGPIAPLQTGDIWGSYHVEGSVLSYIAKQIPTKKIILGLPMYGRTWTTEQLTIPSKVKQFVTHQTLGQILDKHQASIIQFDPISKSNYVCLKNSDGEFEQTWFDGVESLQLKVDFIKKMKLRGVGLWALGYNNGRNEIWELIGQNFGQQEDSVVLASTPSSFISLGNFKRWSRYAFTIMQDPSRLWRNPRPLFMIMSGIIGLNVMLLLLLFRFRCVFKSKGKLNIRMLYFLVVGLSVFVFNILFQWINWRQALLFFGGLLIGGVFIYLWSYKMMVKKELP
ncbi:glycosyl hydrolase family 18 protein [Flammeovirga pacifica]|nr:glycosyl hydrolase family 18 protein [Flammeovirga pacifica]